MGEGHDEDMEEDKEESRPEVSVAASIGQQNKGKKPRGYLADVGEKKENPAKRIGSKIQGTPFLQRLVDCERP